MAAQTGRTVKKWVDFRIHDSGGTMRSIPVDNIGGVGLDYDENDLTAFQDAIKNVLFGHPGMNIPISGPFDTAVAAAAGTLSGSHTILEPVNGATTPLSLDIQIGMRHAWEAGEPQFGITATATDGVGINNYKVDMDSMKYSANVVVLGGGTLPDWGTAAES